MAKHVNARIMILESVSNVPVTDKKFLHVLQTPQIKTGYGSYFEPLFKVVISHMIISMIHSMYV